MQDVTGSLALRRAIPSDAADLAALAARLFTSTYQHVMAPEELAAYVRSHFTADCQARELSDPAMMTVLAGAPHICGYAQLIVGAGPHCPLPATSPGQLKRIYVDPAFHGHGVAPRLLQFIETEARARSCDVLWLAVWEINHRAVAFYQKHGFAIVGRQGFPPASTDLTDYVMAKPLATELH